MEEEAPDLVAAMLDPAFYPDRPDRVELRETHVSWVFLAGELECCRLSRSITVTSSRPDVCRNSGTRETAHGGL